MQTEVTQTDGLYWKRDLFDEQGNESGYDGTGYVCMGAERGGEERQPMPDGQGKSGRRSVDWLVALDFLLLMREREKKTR